MPREKILMQKPMAAYLTKVMGKKFSHVSVCYHAMEERKYRLPVQWAYGYSWAYKDDLDRWVKQREKREALAAKKREAKLAKKRKATSRR